MAATCEVVRDDSRLLPIKIAQQASNIPVHTHNVYKMFTKLKYPINLHAAELNIKHS